DLGTDRLDCRQLDDTATLARRLGEWRAAADAHGGTHPAAAPVTHRVLQRMRASALPALLGGGMTAG
ncbi:MAG TPA: hypothetical protein VMU09_11395, partial [Acidimicrobiales bacterium]|nr:hypothetical protein [Acidimicrobiales bacterium]